MGIYTEERKLEQLRHFRASGKSCNEYCKETGVPRSTMYAWIRKNGNQVGETQPALVKLPCRFPIHKAVAAGTPSKAAPTITLSIGPWSASITSGVSRSDLEILVSVLGGAHHAN